MKVILTISAIVAVLGIVLAVHIYTVTRPPHIDTRTRYMARIDLHQPIGREDSARIKTWLLQQKGVDRVMVSPRWSNAVFTFIPFTDVNGIVQAFRTSLPYHDAVRYLPAKEKKKSRCPVMQ